LRPPDGDLARIGAALGVRLRVVRDGAGVPCRAIFEGRCPLCTAFGADEDEGGTVSRRKAHLALPDLTWRCDSPRCPAGGNEGGEPGNADGEGLAREDWERLFPKLTEGSNGSGATPSPASSDPIPVLPAHGQFYRLDSGAVFVRSEGGEPIPVNSKEFAGVAAGYLKLPRRKGVFKEAHDAIVDYANARASKAAAELLTARDTEGRLLIHLGGGDVRRLEGGRYIRVVNGTGAVVFRTEPDFLPLAVEDLKGALGPDPDRFPALHSAVLNDLPCVVGPLSREEARALLLAAWLLIFVRPWATARPITLVLGPPGCGKTTTQRLLAAAFYGPEGEVGGGASLDRVAKDLLAGAVFQSVVIRDDVTDLPPGGIDTLCRTATGTRVKLSAFHETLALESHTARAAMILSAVRPSWLTRSDLLSRLWIIEFGSHGDSFVMTERERVERVLALRPAIWAETAAALRLLEESLPKREPISRFDSMEQVIAPILERAGYGPAFSSALRKMPAIGAAMAARADPLLGCVAALAHETGGRWLDAASLADELAKALGAQGREREPHLAAGVVRDPVRLGQLLAKIEREGSAVVRVESRMGHGHRKLWRLTPAVGGGGGIDRGLTDQVEEVGDQEDENSSGRDPGIPPLPPRPKVH
jgi:hypothetical protein